MPLRNKKQSDIRNLERERFSNFVVDLRRQVTVVKDRAESEVASLAKKEKKAAKAIFQVATASAEKLKDLAPGLKRDLPRRQKPHRSFVFHLPSIAWPTFRRRHFSIIIKNKQKVLSQRTNYKNLRSVRNSSLSAQSDGRRSIWRRPLLSFSLALILLIVPIKLLSYFDLLDVKSLEQRVIGQSQLALNNLWAAADSVSRLDLKNADSQFEAAGRNFLAAQNDLNNINDALLSLAALSSDPKLKLAAESKKFLSAGAIASSLGRNLVLATDSLFNGPSGDFSATLDNFSRYGQAAVTDAQSLKKELNKIDPDNLPEAYRKKFITLDKQASLLADSLADFVLAADKLKEILGLTSDKRYLLVFQNNAELRASGGFLGSYALVDIREGKVRNLEVPGGGSYDTEGGMKVLVKAPQPLWLVNPLWHFWDANWWPDWPTTAQNLMWFYEKSGGPSVDGIISVTPTVVESLLEITGPIDLTKEYGLIIDKDNFWETVQKITEQKNLAKERPESLVGIPASSTPINSLVPLKQDLENNSDNKPKKIIGDLMAKIMEVLPTKLNQDNLVKILSLFEENMAEKQVLFYFRDSALQSEMSARNYAGEVRDTDHDYLLVVDTNIAGQKSDRKIEERIEHESVIDTNGSIIDTVKIYRAHTGYKNEPLVGVRNVDWLRVYVPQGSELISADGFRAPEEQYLQERPDPSWQSIPLLASEDQAATEQLTGTKIYTENNKTVFANWAMVDPGETAVITLKYRVPGNLWAQPQKDGWLNRLNKLLNPEQKDFLSYSFLVQKQPGARNAAFSSRLSLPENVSVFWRHPDNLAGSRGWEINDSLNSDKYYSVLLNRN